MKRLCLLLPLLPLFAFAQGSEPGIGELSPQEVHALNSNLVQPKKIQRDLPLTPTEYCGQQMAELYRKIDASLKQIKEKALRSEKQKALAAKIDKFLGSDIAFEKSQVPGYKEFKQVPTKISDFRGDIGIFIDGFSPRHFAIKPHKRFELSLLESDYPKNFMYPESFRSLKDKGSATDLCSGGVGYSTIALQPIGQKPKYFHIGLAVEMELESLMADMHDLKEAAHDVESEEDAKAITQLQEQARLLKEDKRISRADGFKNGR